MGECRHEPTHIPYSSCPERGAGSDLSRPRRDGGGGHPDDGHSAIAAHGQPRSGRRRRARRRGLGEIPICRLGGFLPAERDRLARGPGRQRLHHPDATPRFAARTQLLLSARVRQGTFTDPDRPGPHVQDVAGDGPTCARAAGGRQLHELRLLLRRSQGRRPKRACRCRRPPARLSRHGEHSPAPARFLRRRRRQRVLRSSRHNRRQDAAGTAAEMARTVRAAAGGRSRRPDRHVLAEG